MYIGTDGVTHAEEYKHTQKVDMQQHANRLRDEHRGTLTVVWADTYTMTYVLEEEAS